MKKDLLSIICMTLVCATVMLGVMSIYKFFGATATSRKRIGYAGQTFESSAIDFGQIV